MISRTSRTLVVTACAALLAAAGCTSDGKGAPSSGLPSATDSPGLRTSAPARASGPAPAQGTVRVTRTVATGLDVPWGMALLPGGDVLVSSRDTFHIHRVARDGRRTTDAGTVPGVASNGSQGGEGGLLGLALSPGYAADHRVYVYYSTTSDNRIAYLTYDEHAPAGRQLGTPHVVLTGIPHGLHHNGGRIAFGPDGMLYAGTGEAGHPALAQDVTSLGGKVLRMTPAGT
uniref:PQQ-dependent sugar dehydrogenase n=1 Tax=Peterkaempfera griseoplana TaxID=66896 RepID=UPI000B096525